LIFWSHGYKDVTALRTIGQCSNFIGKGIEIHSALRWRRTGGKVAWLWLEHTLWL